ncbi:MAG: molybdate ABC transporter substrate-binding protein [Pseudomonadota bacterium]
MRHCAAMICVFRAFARVLPAFGLAFWLALQPTTAGAEVARVAVASNFSTAAKLLAAEFEATSIHRIRLSSGSTGKLYSQLRLQAPFDAFLAADQERPRLLEAGGFAVAGSRFTYAVGRLVLWSPTADSVGPRDLERGEFRRIAIAQPALAPYGAAAIEVIESLGLRATLEPKLVYGENIGQTFAFVASGNAELGFVAASQLGDRAGARWLPPEASHLPVRQDAVLINADSMAAREFLAFLRSDAALALLHDFGYAPP